MSTYGLKSVFGLIACLVATSGLPTQAQQYVFVSSFNNSSVLRYNAKTGAFIDAFVPKGTGGLVNTGDQVFGPDGNLYVSTSGNSQSVLRYNGKTGAFIDALTSGSTDSYPQGLAFGP